MTKDITPPSLVHPAAYSKRIMDHLEQIVRQFVATHMPWPNHRPIIVLDPFAGTGKIHKLRELPDIPVQTRGVEIEPEWAAMHPHTIQGDATHLQFDAHHFDMVITSPAYGNRLADKHDAKDGSIRRSYTHDLRRLTGDNTRKLHPNNAGGMHFGSQYMDLHIAAWKEVWRVLRPEGWFVLNVSDFIKNGDTVPVAHWHLGVCLDMGFNHVDSIEVETPRLRYGRNAEARVATERIFVLSKPPRP